MKSLCDRELREAYRKFNARYFSGRLPAEIDLLFAPAECYGLVRREGDGWALIIDPRYAIDGRTWRLTLLHEMAHLAVHPYRWHGQQFQAEMLRLAQAGAFRGLW